MDSGSEAAGESRLSYTSAAGGRGRHMATGGGRRGALLPLVVFPAPSWADVPVDILGGVLRLLPCVADRASVQSVCRHWRAAARAHALPAPLPVLVLPCFRFLCLTSDGQLTGARHGLLSTQVAGNDDIVGSCDDWLMTVRSNGYGMETARECCLVNAFSREVVHLPPLPRNSKYNCLDVSSSAHWSEDDFEESLHYSALSGSPSSMSKYTVAGLTFRGFRRWRCLSGLALWQPGMTSWYLCLSAQINSFSGDLAFYQGKLYMVSCKWNRPDIFAFELLEDEHGVRLTCPDHYRIDLLIPSVAAGRRTMCNLVVWRGKLLLFIRLFSCHNFENCDISNVQVFALDFRTTPCGLTQIHNLDGDCIFVQRGGCRSFSPGLHDGVQGDLVYFSDECFPRFPYVYNMRDGTARCFGASLTSGRLGFPVWIFPSSCSGGEG